MQSTRLLSLCAGCALALACLSICIDATASDDISSFNPDNLTLSPGRMGPNALPVPYTNEILIPDRTILELYGEYHLDPHQELTINPFFRLVVPIRGAVALSIFGRPLEYFSTNSRRREERHAARSQAITRGDIYLQTSLCILDHNRIPLGLTLNVGFKSTTGKGLRDARHINAPGYWADLTMGHVLHITCSTALQLRAAAYFLGWQTNIDEQNDAAGFSTAATLILERWTLGTEFSGYRGWMDNGDKPLVLRTSLSRRLLDNVEVHAGFQRGIRDQLPFLFRGGLRVLFSFPKQSNDVRCRA